VRDEATNVQISGSRDTTVKRVSTV